MEKSLISELAVRNIAEINKHVKRLQKISSAIADKIEKTEDEKELYELQTQLTGIDYQLQVLRYER